MFEVCTNPSLRTLALISITIFFAQKGLSVWSSHDTARIVLVERIRWLRTVPTVARMFVHCSTMCWKHERQTLSQNELAKLLFPKDFTQWGFVQSCSDFSISQILTSPSTSSLPLQENPTLWGQINGTFISFNFSIAGSPTTLSPGKRFVLWSRCLLLGTPAGRPGVVVAFFLDESIGAVRFCRTTWLFRSSVTSN